MIMINFPEYDLNQTDRHTYDVTYTGSTGITRTIGEIDKAADERWTATYNRVDVETVQAVGGFSHTTNKVVEVNQDYSDKWGAIAAIIANFEEVK